MHNVTHFTTLAWSSCVIHDDHSPWLDCHDYCPWLGLSCVIHEHCPWLVLFITTVHGLVVMCYTWPLSSHMVWRSYNTDHTVLWLGPWCARPHTPLLPRMAGELKVMSYGTTRLQSQGFLLKAWHSCMTPLTSGDLTLIPNVWRVKASNICFEFKAYILKYDH